MTNYSPRQVRNFWIELQVDGKKGIVASGPKHKDGGFHLDIFGKVGGQVVKIFEVKGYVNAEGKRQIAIENADGGHVMYELLE